MGYRPNSQNPRPQTTLSRVEPYQPFTTDADVVLDPGLLSPIPPLGRAMEEAGFTLTAEPGIWEAHLTRPSFDEAITVPVDLIVPQQLAPKAGRRSARLPGDHGKATARKSPDLEGAVVDNSPIELSSLEEGDTRLISVNVAGFGALFVAKLHKLGDRLDTPDRLLAKDAGDVYRLFDAISPAGMAAALQLLLADDRSAATTTKALDYLEQLFVTPTSTGTRLAVEALRTVLPEVEIGGEEASHARPIVTAGLPLDQSGFAPMRPCETLGMLVVRGTKKLRDRVKGAPAGDDDASTTALGDWFATALFWRPQVALLVNTRTFIPVFVELAPAAKLLDRVPAAIEATLRAHGVDEAFIGAEVEAMTDVRIAPTNDRSVLGVMNEFAFLGEHHQAAEPVDLMKLSLRLAGTPLGPLRKSTRFPDRELAAVVGDTSPLADVIPIRPGQPKAVQASPAAETKGAIYQLKVTLHDTKPPIWRRVLIDGTSTLDQVHDVIQAAFGWGNYHLHDFRIGGTEYGVPDPDSFDASEFDENLRNQELVSFDGWT